MVCEAFSAAGRYCQYLIKCVVSERSSEQLIVVAMHSVHNDRAVCGKMFRREVLKRRRTVHGSTASTVHCVALSVSVTRVLKCACVLTGVRMRREAARRAYDADKVSSSSRVERNDFCYMIYR